ncbi:hypothetical protein ACQZ44_18510 [Agrobacterium vitis]
MQETVSINDLTLCHKHSDGWVRSTLPDLCISQDKPVPYTNTAYARALAKGTTTVFSHGGAMNGSRVPNSTAPSAMNLETAHLS